MANYLAWLSDTQLLSLPMKAKPAKALWDLLALSGSETLGKIAGFVAFATLARIFCPSDYGAIELAVSLLAFFASIVDFGLGPIGSRAVTHSPHNAGHYAALIPAIRILLVLLAVPAMAVTAFVMAVPDATVQLVLVISLALFAMPFNQQWLFQGLERMTWVSLGQALHMFVFMLGVVLFARHSDSLLMVGAIEIVAVASTAIWFVYLQYRLPLPLRLSFDKPALVLLVRHAFPVGAGKIVWTLNQNLPTVTVALLSSAVEVAWYAAAVRIVNALLSFSMIYHFNLYPSVVSRLQHSHASFLVLCEASFRLCAWAGAAVALYISLIVEPLIVFAFGESYAIASTPLVILVWTVPVMLLSSHARWALVASNRQQYVLYSQIGGVVVGVLACLLFVPSLGATGGSIAMLLSSLAVWALSHRYASQMIGPLPLVSSLLPLVLSLFIAAMRNSLGISGWGTSTLYVVVFLLLVPVFDRKILDSIRTLVSIKNTINGGVL